MQISVEIKVFGVGGHFLNESWATSGFIVLILVWLSCNIGLELNFCLWSMGPVWGYDGSLGVQRTHTKQSFNKLGA